MTTTTKRALIVVDVQNSFASDRPARSSLRR